jgi:hypothetical protein
VPLGKHRQGTHRLCARQLELVFILHALDCNRVDACQTGMQRECNAAAQLAMALTLLQAGQLALVCGGRWAVGVIRQCMQRATVPLTGGPGQTKRAPSIAAPWEIEGTAIVHRSESGTRALHKLTEAIPSVPY